MTGQVMVNVFLRFAPTIVLRSVLAIAHRYCRERVLSEKPVAINEDVCWVLEADGGRIPIHHVCTRQNLIQLVKWTMLQFVHILEPKALLHLMAFELDVRVV